MSDARGKKEEQAFLRVAATDGTIHLLPYGHLLHVILECKPDQPECLAMQGAISNVVITGKGLAKFLAGIQSLTLESIAAGDQITNIQVSIREA